MTQEDTAPIPARKTPIDASVFLAATLGELTNDLERLVELFGKLSEDELAAEFTEKTGELNDLLEKTKATLESSQDVIAEQAAFNHSSKDKISEHIRLFYAAVKTLESSSRITDTKLDGIKLAITSAATEISRQLVKLSDQQAKQHQKVMQRLETLEVEIGARVDDNYEDFLEALAQEKQPTGIFKRVASFRNRTAKVAGLVGLGIIIGMLDEKIIKFARHNGILPEATQNEQGSPTTSEITVTPLPANE